MIRKTLLSEKGLAVLQGTSLAAASRISLAGNTEQQYELFDWTHSPATLLKKVNDNFEEIEEDKFINEILDFKDKTPKRIYFMVSPQGTGKSEACISVKHAFEKKFSNSDYPPVLYVQRDAPAIKFLNKSSAHADWLGEDKNHPDLKAFGETDDRLAILKRMISDGGYDSKLNAIVGNIVAEAELKYDKRTTLDTILYSLLEKYLAEYLAGHFQNDKEIRKKILTAESRKDFFDRQDDSSERGLRLSSFVDSFRREMGNEAHISDLYDLLNNNIQKNLGSEAGHLSKIISAMGNIARQRNTHLLVIFEDFRADPNSTDTVKYSDLVTSDQILEEDQKDNITVLFAGLQEGIEGLRQRSQDYTQRVTGEFRTAETEEEGASSVVVSDPVEFARKYILWAKKDEGLIENYNIDDSINIPSPDSDYNDWDSLTPLNQQLFPLSDNSINFIWDNLINKHPRSFLDFIRKLLDGTTNVDYWHPVSRIKLFHRGEMKESWDNENRDGFYSNPEYIFYKMYCSENDNAEVIRQIFEIDSWGGSEEIIQDSEEPEDPEDPPNPETSNVARILAKWKDAGPSREEIKADVYEFEKKVWEGVLDKFFNFSQGGINYENPRTKEILLTKNINLIKPRNLEESGDHDYRDYGLKLSEYAEDFLERGDYREFVVKLGSHIDEHTTTANKFPWFPFSPEQEKIMSQIVAITNRYVQNKQEQLRRLIRFEDLENKMISFKIFEGMWHTLLDKEPIYLNYPKKKEFLWFHKGRLSQAKDILEKTRIAIEPGTEFNNHKGPFTNILNSVNTFANTNFNEIDFFTQIFEYRIRDKRCLTSSKKWTRHLSESNTTFVNSLKGWSLTKKNNKVEKWLTFIHLFSQRWFQSGAGKVDDSVSDYFYFPQQTYGIIRTDSTIESKIKSLKTSGDEGEIRDKWNKIKNIDLDYLFHDDIFNHVFDLEHEITNNSGVPFIISYAQSIKDVNTLYEYFNKIHLQAYSQEKISQSSEEEIFEHWDKMRDKLINNSQINDTLNQIVYQENLEAKIPTIDSLLDLIIDGTESLKDVKIAILLRLIEDVLFEKSHDFDLGSILSDSNFNLEDLRSYGKSLAAADPPDQEKALILQKTLKLYLNRKITTIIGIEELFFAVHEYHVYFVNKNELWPDVIDAVLNNKSLNDIKLKELQKEYGDVLTLEFKKSN